MNSVAILLCGGAGNRMMGQVKDKILADLNGRPVFDYSLLAFEASRVVSSYVVVYRDAAQQAKLADRLRLISKKTVIWIEGGEERQDSVSNALEATPANTGVVMIHDCARPLVKAEMIQQVHQAAMKDHSAVLAHRSIDTIKRVDDSKVLCRAELQNLDRHKLWAMETPQAFSLSLIREAYNQLNGRNIRVTDDTAAVIHFGHRVTLIENPFPNPKITLPQDLAIVEVMLQQVNS